MPDYDSGPAPRKVSEDREQERELFRFLLENIPDRIYFKDKESRFIRGSRALADFFRAAGPEGLVGKTDFDFFTREHAEPAFEDEQQVMRTGQPIIGKVERETLPDGRVRWAMTTKMPLRNAQGAIIGTCGISKNFTAQKALEDALAESNAQLGKRQEELQQALADLKKAHENLKAMQQQLVEAEKMQMVGRLAYGVAHEIRNPLNILHAGLDFFANEVEVVEDESNKAILGEMQTAVRRADLVISALMESSSEGAFKLESCEIRGPIERALTTLDAEFRLSGIEVLRDLAADLPPLLIDRSKLEQVFESIFRNAIDAMSNGGQLTVRTRRKQLTAAEVERDPGLRSAERFRGGESVLAIEIDDRGSGISKDALPQVFDPFFTTKETGSGTGMGLTVGRKIIQLHHGAMQIANRDEGGVRVTIFLKIASHPTP